MSPIWPRFLSLRLCALICPFAVLTGLALAAPAPKDRTAGYQAKADEAKWAWPAERASLDYCLRDSPIPATPYKNLEGNLTISLRVSGTHDVEFKGHGETVFVVGDKAVYYAEFHPHSTGCEVVAVDLKTGKQLWRHDLKGLGPIAHSKYRNQVVLEIDELTVRVLGKESAGRYLEYVDRDSGRTVGHKVFKND
jgi:hypothetical protein